MRWMNPPINRVLIAPLPIRGKTKESPSDLNIFGTAGHHLDFLQEQEGERGIIGRRADRQVLHSCAIRVHDVDLPVAVVVGLKVDLRPTRCAYYLFHPPYQCRTSSPP